MNLFMLGAPYQVLSALEAIHHFKFFGNHLKILDTGHFTRRQFESVIDKAAWVSVEFHNFRYKLRPLNYHPGWPNGFWEHLLEYYLQFDRCIMRQRANRIAQKTVNLDNLVVGNYRREYNQHMRHLVNRLKFKRLIVLDTGTDILRVNQDRHAEKIEPRNDNEKESVKKGLGYIKHLIRKNLLAWDVRGIESVTFFTAYDLKPAPGDIVVKNNFEYLKSITAETKPVNKVLFVGQPLIDQGYISLESFMKTFSWIKCYFGGQEIVYIPHPREANVQVEVIRKLGMSIQRFTAPFEYALAFSGERPSCIASFFSSALENCSAIFGATLPLLAFRLPEEFLLKDHASVGRLYAQLTTSSQAIIEIKVFDPNFRYSI